MFARTRSLKTEQSTNMRVIVMEAYIYSGSVSCGALSRVLGNAVRRMSSASLVIYDTMCIWSERIRQRRQLLRLSDQMLRNIGVSQVDAFKEWEKLSGRYDRPAPVPAAGLTTRQISTAQRNIEKFRHTPRLSERPIT
jgi:uncharacterized protein YjiS (DUF1127 family)